MSFSPYTFCGACRSDPRKSGSLGLGDRQNRVHRETIGHSCSMRKQTKNKNNIIRQKEGFLSGGGHPARLRTAAAAAAAQASPRSPFPARGGGRGQAVFSGISLPREALPLVSRLRLFLSPFQFRLMNCLRQSRMPTAASSSGATVRAIRESKVARYLSCRLPRATASVADANF